MSENGTAESQPVVRLTDKAIAKVQAFAGQHPEAGDKHLRIYIQGGSRASYEYGFTFDESQLGDEIIRQDPIQVLVDPYSAMYLRGSQVDFVEDLRGSGFVVENPNKPPLLLDPIAERIQTLIQERINPGIASHGGWVSLIDYEDGRVFVQLGGGCQGCGMVDVTLKQGIEQILKQEVPEVHEVLDTTDHASGTNPYYSSGK